MERESSVRSLLHVASSRLFALVNWFIPEKLKADADVVQGVRMFLISHFFGPFLGHTISLYILYIQGTPDLAWMVFFVSITLFWPFSFALRLTEWYVPLAFISIQNLLFCILWGCYHYGGVSSPILPMAIRSTEMSSLETPSRSTPHRMAAGDEVLDECGAPAGTRRLPGSRPRSPRSTPASRGN